MGERKDPPSAAVAEYGSTRGALPPHLSLGLDHFKRQKSKIPPLATFIPPNTHPTSLEELWGAWGRLHSQAPGGEVQPNLLGPHLVNSALGLTYFLGEKIEYRFKCSGALENYGLAV